MPPFNRKPLDQRGYPTPSGPPQAIYGPEDECAQIPFLKAALNAAVTGIVPKEIRDSDRWMQFQNANVVELRKLIQRLDVQCTHTHGRGRAIRYGGYNFPRFGGYGPYFGGGGY